MIGAVIGDIVGSIYEFDNIKTKDFPLFDECSMMTDDTVCSVALADCLLNDGDPVKYLQDYCRRFPSMSYGYNFSRWIDSNNPKPYGSWGNGAAMRISPIAFYLDDWEEIGWKTVKYTEITHNDPHGINGALCTSEAIFLGKSATNKKYLIDVLLKYYPTFDLSLTLDMIRPHFKFDESCQGTVPYAIRCVLESVDFEDAIRNAISLGGDCDTVACIAGGIAQSYYKEIPQSLLNQANWRLPASFNDIINKISPL